MDESRRAFGGLDEVGEDGFAEQGHHGAGGVEVLREDRLAGAGLADDDAAEACAEIFAAAGERHDGHDLGGRGDDEAGMAGWGRALSPRVGRVLWGGGGASLPLSPAP